MCVSVYVRMCVCELWYCFHKIKKKPRTHTPCRHHSHFGARPMHVKKKKREKIQDKGPSLRTRCVRMCVCIHVYACTSLFLHTCACIPAEVTWTQIARSHAVCSINVWYGLL